jgi:hypothetical protein
VEETDRLHRWLLRMGSNRARRRAAEQRDELAALHSTSSARASSMGGASRPSAFALLHLPGGKFMLLKVGQRNYP